MKFIPNAVSRTVARQVLLTQKNSPQLLFGAGIFGVVATAVLASKATLKLEEALDTNRTQKIIAAELLEKRDPNYDESKYRKDVISIQIRSAVVVCRLYAPAVIVGVATVGCLFTSQQILNKRNAALVAAYSALDKRFNEYRSRVTEKYGEDKEQELYYETATGEIEVDGKVKKTKQRIGGGSIYARLFEETNKNYSNNPEYNVMFLRAQQNYANDLLRMQGHVFLNEIYDALGLARSTEGAVVGWVWKKGSGDQFIDFGIFDSPDMNKFYDFVTGHEKGIWLDFNVDGIVYDKI